METVTRTEDCAACKDCCKFRKEKLYFAPLFTREEVETIKQDLDQLPHFSPHRGSKTVYQIELRPSADRRGLYICPFLDEPSNLCHIYNHEPFDCRIWPFLITKSQDGQSIHLVCFTRENCPSLGCINREEFEAYKRYIMDYVTTPEFLKLLHAHEALIWDYQDGTRFVADLTEKVKDEGGRFVPFVMEPPKSVMETRPTRS